MKIEQGQVREFMVKADQEIPDRPTMPSPKIRELRVRLIAEELLELCEAFDIDISIKRVKNVPQANHCAVEMPIATTTDTDLVEAYDALLDLLVVVIGSGIALGMDLTPGWEEVHRSNMSKFIDGYLREDGKWIKGPSYIPAQLTGIIQSQTDAAKLKDRQLLLENMPPK